MATSIINHINEIHIKNSSKIKYNLLKVSHYRQTCNEKEDPECAICYKRISNKVFVCAKPCYKTFHPSCMEKLIDQIEETAYNDDDDQVKPCYQCCYCRREFDIGAYDTTLFVQELLYAKGCGYCVDDAITQCILNGMEGDEAPYQYEIYIPEDTKHFKKPKQSKRTSFKNKHKHTRLHMNKCR